MTEELRTGTWLGNAELVLRIGRGGMATVWVARQHGATADQDRLVAVKAMLADLADEPEFVQMFRDEVNLITRIRHPNVVDVYGVGEHQGTMYMLMEWVEGDSLHTLIAEAAKRSPIPAEIAVRIIADAAGGLHAAHELKDENGTLQGVVHRDVSPHNILLGTNGAIKLVDFGVAKALGRLSEATRAGQLKGKFGYMSPEQAMGRPVDRRSDVFSLGIVLFELTTNRRLFRGDSDVETLHLVISGQIPRPSQIESRYPPKLEAIVLKALERDLDKRYETAEALRKDLLGYLSEERIVVPQSGLASLLKRVTGERIEQRRKAVRGALKSLVSTAGTTKSELLSSESAFTPTGNEKITVTGISTVTASQVTGISVHGVTAGGTQSQITNGSRTFGGPVSSAGMNAKQLTLALYLVGFAGILLAIVLLVIFAGNEPERAPLPSHAVDAAAR
jgi:eukaryotic-like serine/threonine-protein kinase